MFRFFKRKPSPAASAPEAAPAESQSPDLAAPATEAEPASGDKAGSAAPAAGAVDASQEGAALPQDESLAPQAADVEASAAAEAIPAASHSPEAEPAPACIASPEPDAVVPDAPLVVQPHVPSPAADVPVEKPDAEAKEKGSWLSRLRKGLARTGQSIGGLFVGVKVDETLFEELETALIMADAGVEATEQLLAALRARVRKERLDQPEQVRAALRDILAAHLKPLEKTFPLRAAKPLVVMIAGVNGAGKTTSIGKLAHAFQAQGASVLLAAGDTFRAAARQQLMEWGARNNVAVIAQDGADPAAVAFDAVNAGRARGADVVMVDTAGRLPTQLHLMEELKKIRRVTGKAQADAPHEVLLVVDGNTGQNVLAQIRAFDAAINLTGLVVTKLDGTAKGGTLAAVAAGSQGVRPIPVYWIGVGESMGDLQPFVASEFAQAVVG